TYATSSGIATYATSAGIATYATLSGLSTYATSSGIATYATSAGIATYATTAGVSTNLKGGLVGNVPYQSAPDTTVFLTNGASGTVLQSNGVGNAPTWVPAAPANAITGLTIRDEGTIVGGASSVSQLNFVGNIVSVASTAGIATITFLDYVSNAGVATYATSAGIATYATSSGIATSVIGGIGSITQLQVTGVSTFTNGPVLIGSATSTGTASQPLQVTGNAYVSGNIGLGTTNPPDKLTVSGKIQIQQDSGSNNRLVFRGQPASSYRWNIDNNGSSNDFRIFREDDATAANGSVAVSISTIGTLTATKFSGDGSLLTNLPSSSSQWVTTSAGIHTLSNVGVGTTNPQYKTHIVGSADVLALESTSASDRTTLKLLTNGNDWEVGARGSAASPANTFYIYDNASNQYRQVIDSSGNVGLGGTTSPGERLQVDGNIRVGISTTSNYIAFYGTTGDLPGSYNHTYIGERIWTTGTEKSELFIFKGNDADSGNGPDRIRLAGGQIRIDTYTTATGGVSFESVAISTNLINRVVVHSTGEVGIGSDVLTGTSSQLLQVAGGGYFNGSVGIGTTNPSSRLSVVGDALIVGVATANSFRARGGSPGAVGVNNNGYGFFGSGDNDSGMYSSADGQIEFYSNSVEAARITTNRNLLIGATSDTGTATQPLQVTGGAYVSGNLGVGRTNPSALFHLTGGAAIGAI
ncbi:MAG: hypothetical protein EBU08_15710, partial [Micrococcales bacterium]|nr:hypothetical protein [Micrococcales bacterium]